MGDFKLYCLDSDILISFLRKSDEAKSFLDSNKQVGFGVSVISHFELLAGANLSKKRVSNEKYVRTLLGRIPRLELTLEVIEKSSDILAALRNQGKVIEVRDIFIAGTCLANDIPIVTRNVTHYERIEGIEIIRW